jgi:outer membrane protein
MSERFSPGLRADEGRLIFAALLLVFASVANAQTLDDVIARAIAHSPELRVLEAGVDEARANAALADVFRSTATVSATPGYATGLPTSILGQVPAIGTIEGHRILYDPSARAEQLGAISGVEAATARLDERKREIAQNAAEVYARLAAEDALVASAHERVAAYETVAAHTDALRQEGRARDLDADRAALQVASAKRAELQATSRRDLDQLRLDRLAGDHVQAALVIPSVSEGSGGAGGAQLQIYDAQIQKLQQALAYEERLFQPVIAAQIQYSRLFDRFRRYYNHFRADDFSAGANISVPIWVGGHRDATVARVKAQLAELVAAREARKYAIDLAIAEARADLSQALAEKDLADRSHTVAAEGLRIAEELAREGRGESNDVPLARIALTESDDDTTNATAHIMKARAWLLIVHGELPGPQQ